MNAVELCSEQGYRTVISLAKTGHTPIPSPGSGVRPLGGSSGRRTKENTVLFLDWSEELGHGAEPLAP